MLFGFDFCLTDTNQAVKFPSVRKGLLKQNTTVILYPSLEDRTKYKPESFIQETMSCLDVIALSISSDQVIAGNDGVLVQFLEQFQDRDILANVVFFVNSKEELTPSQVETVTGNLIAMAKIVWKYDISQNRDWYFLNTAGMDSCFQFDYMKPYCFKNPLELNQHKEKQSSFGIEILLIPFVTFGLFGVLISILRCKIRSCKEQPSGISQDIEAAQEGNRHENCPNKNDVNELLKKERLEALLKEQSITYSDESVAPEVSSPSSATSDASEVSSASSDAPEESSSYDSSSNSSDYVIENMHIIPKFRALYSK